jgi:hypothetical protein
MTENGPAGGKHHNGQFFGNKGNGVRATVACIFPKLPQLPRRILKSAESPNVFKPASPFMLDLATLLLLWIGVNQAREAQQIEDVGDFVAHFSNDQIALMLAHLTKVAISKPRPVELM